MQSISTIGLDIAKSVFQVPLMRPAKWCYAGSCGAGTFWHFSKNCRHAWWASRRAPSRHHWSRELQALGHAVLPK